MSENTLRRFEVRAADAVDERFHHAGGTGHGPTRCVVDTMLGGRQSGARITHSDTNDYILAMALVSRSPAWTHLRARGAKPYAAYLIDDGTIGSIVAGPLCVTSRRRVIHAVLERETPVLGVPTEALASTWKDLSRRAFAARPGSLEEYPLGRALRTWEEVLVYLLLVCDAPAIELARTERLERRVGDLRAEAADRRRAYASWMCRGR